MNFIDLKTPYLQNKKSIDEAVLRVVASTQYIGNYDDPNSEVSQFSRELEAAVGVAHAIPCNSGTTALLLAFLSIGLNSTNEVIFPSFNFIAGPEIALLLGAKPVFVDIDEQTYNMDPHLLEDVITPGTKAIIPIHLYGQTADMDPIMKIANDKGLFVIEDACQAHGAEYNGKPAGSIGDAGCFSFYPGKNLGAYGEAGAVVTNNTQLTENMRMFRDHGQEKKYYHSMIGWNARMDGFQGAVLSVKLKYLNQWNKSRRKNARLYNELLADVDGIIVPQEADYAKHIYHLYVIRTQNRDAFIAALAENEVFCGIHYPIPLHLQDAYSSLGYKKGDFPVAEKCCEQLVSLPMFPELSSGQIEYVAEKIKSLISVH